MRKIRYIAVHIYNDFSGSPRVLADFCLAKTLQKASLTVVTNQSRGFLTENLGALHLIWYPRFNCNPLKLLSFLLAQFQIFFAVLFICAKSRFAGERVIVINNTIFAVSSMIASWMSRALTVVYIHEIPNQQRILKKFIEKVIDLTADEVLVVSKILKDRYSLPNCRITLFPNGIRSDFYLSEQLVHKDKFRYGKVLFVGSLKTYKGIHELLYLASRMPNAEFEASLNCSRAELNKFEESVIVPKNLCMISRATDLEERYRKAFIVLNLSRAAECFEGFGLTILEGMAAGCPCVVPLRGGHMDYFSAHAGIAADSTDFKVIIDYIARLREDEGSWREASDNARRIANGYSNELFLERVNYFICEILERYEQKGT